MAETTINSEILTAISGQSCTAIGHALTRSLMAQIATLRQAGQTEAQIQVTLLSTYAPAIAAIATCRAFSFQNEQGRSLLDNLRLLLKK